MRSGITPEYLREVLSYDPDTGIFRWKISDNRARAGAIAGNCDPEGYVMIGISGKRYMAQRLAWLYVNGVWPDEINFINGVKGDNRLENLREAHRADNVRNRGMQKNNTSGVKGVNQHKGRGKWIARCMVDGKSHCLGFFSDITEAEKSVRQFRERNHGEFACHG